MMYCKNSTVGGFLFLIVFACWINAKSSEAFGTFGFDIHHRYSDTVKDFLDVDGLPAKGSLDYYSAMAHRDQLFKARRLATSTATTPVLTFFGGNDTFRLSSLGFPSYNVTVTQISVESNVTDLEFMAIFDSGTSFTYLNDPAYSIIVQGFDAQITEPRYQPVRKIIFDYCYELSATQTSYVVPNLNFTMKGGSQLSITAPTIVIPRQQLDLNIYSPSTSSTSQSIPCNSTMCGPRRGCAVRLNACAYQEVYLSSNTSSTGILVDDVLHLGTDQNPQGIIEAPITLGFGMIQTGDFLDAAAINGLFGLGMDNVFVPSILASKGLTANSFSMCFGPDGIGRIEFGDKGTPDQSVTPFNIEQPHPSYNVTVTQISVESNVTDLEFTAIFDSGTSFTYLNDPAYSVIVQGFGTGRFGSSSMVVVSAYADFVVNIPEERCSIYPQGGYAYCLAVVKSADINIIGQNFMIGYRMVFDREEMVLGWTASDCYDSVSSNNGSNTLPVNKCSPAGAPPPSVLEPEATPNRTRSAAVPSLPPPSPPSSTRPLFGNDAARINSMANSLLMVIPIFLHQFFVLSS
ncbi:UNVERIFIED_CONTAM: Aspartyl protease family protein 1 [Sesamum radiatum]|uniref:Aspartyl protease family protein 1 n=1 Tax=Sesamum radiatum TaxID=300843 RepID=A0AAW2S576_SESRA